MPNAKAELGLEVGRRLRANWFGSVRQISDIDLQRRMWLAPENRNPYWSYVEFIENFPYPDQLADAHERGWLSPREFTVLSELGKKLSGHTAPNGDDYDQASILADPAWHSIVADAEHARRELLAVVSDASERKMLHAGE